MEIITDNDADDLQNKLSVLNFHEKELIYLKYYSQNIYRNKIYFHYRQLVKLMQE